MTDLDRRMVEAGMANTSQIFTSSPTPKPAPNIHTLEEYAQWLHTKFVAIMTHEFWLAVEGKGGPPIGLACDADPLYEWLLAYHEAFKTARLNFHQATKIICTSNIDDLDSKLEEKLKSRKMISLSEFACEAGPTGFDLFMLHEGVNTPDKYREWLTTKLQEIESMKKSSFRQKENDDLREWIYGRGAAYKEILDTYDGLSQ